MRRLTRKKLKQNEFVTVADQIIDWVVDNWRPVVGGLVALCLGFVLWWGISSWRTSREMKASVALNEAVQLFKADETSGKPADVKTAEKKLEDVVQQYGGTAEGDAARLYLARIAFQKGDAARAKSLLKRVAAKHRGDALGRLATLDLIQMRVASGEAAEVAKDLEGMLSGKDDRLPRDAAMYELARVYMAEQKPDQAKTYFEKLVKDFPESPYKILAQQQMQNLS